MRRVAFINEKGGTCKTTLCVNVGAWLATRGRKRVLVADLDTQGHAGKSLGVDVRSVEHTVKDLLLGTAPLEAVVQPTSVAGLEVLPANKDLANFPVAVAAAPDRAERLRSRLATLPEGAYDLVLLDAPPSISLVTENVLVAATEVVVPVALPVAVVPLGARVPVVAVLPVVAAAPLPVAAERMAGRTEPPDIM